MRIKHSSSLLTQRALFCCESQHSPMCLHYFNLTLGFPTSECSVWAALLKLRCAGSCVDAWEGLYSIGF